MTMERFLVILLLCLAKNAIGAPSERYETDHEDVIRYTLRRDVDQDWVDELNDPECLTAKKIVEDTKEMVQKALPDTLIDLQNPKFHDEKGKIACLVTLTLRGLRDHSKKSLEKRIVLNIPGLTLSHTGELFDPCTEAGQCTTQHSHCDLGDTDKCICDQGYVSEVGERHTCFQVVGVGDICKKSFQCSGMNSLCSADPDNAAQKKCQCKPGYTLHSESEDCVKYASKLKSPCTVDEQCTTPFPNSKCFSHKCECRKGYVEKNGQCKERVKPRPVDCGTSVLHGNCDSRCTCDIVEGATCDTDTKKCVCHNDRIELYGKCVERKNSGEACTYAEQCPHIHHCAMAPGDTKKTCVCDDGYVMLEGAACLKVSGLDKACEYDIQCFGAGMKCKSKKCACESLRAPSISNPGTCVLKLLSSVSSFTVSFAWDDDLADQSSSLYRRVEGWVVNAMSRRFVDVRDVECSPAEEGKTHVSFKHTITNTDAQVTRSYLKGQRSSPKDDLMAMKRLLELAAKEQGLHVSDFNNEIEYEE